MPVITSDAPATNSGRGTSWRKTAASVEATTGSRRANVEAWWGVNPFSEENWRVCPSVVGRRACPSNGGSSVEVGSLTTSPVVGEEAAIVKAAVP
jgi:hypothetical protein